MGFLRRNTQNKSRTDSALRTIEKQTLAVLYRDLLKFPLSDVYSIGKMARSVSNRFIKVKESGLSEEFTATENPERNPDHAAKVKQLMFR